MISLFEFKFKIQNSKFKFEISIVDSGYGKGRNSIKWKKWVDTWRKR